MALALSATLATAENRVPIPDSAVRSFARQLAAKDAELKVLGKPVLENSPAGTPESPIVLDEIRVYGQIDPEDYVKRKERFAAFRERLERDRPLTPKEKARLALCLVGLCGLYGPDGLPREVRATDRTEARTLRSSSELHRQFRGTLQ